jgi:hypothetical protein
MPTYWPPSAAHPVIVLITVQGLLRITHRAGKFLFSKEQLELCRSSPRARIFSSENFKNIFQFLQPALAPRPAAALN